MQAFLLISISFGLDPSAPQQSDPRQEKFSYILFLHFLLMFFYIGMGRSQLIKTRLKNHFCTYGNIERRTAIPVYSKEKPALSFPALHLRDRKSSSMDKESVFLSRTTKFSRTAKCSQWAIQVGWGQQPRLPLKDDCADVGSFLTPT